MLDGQPQPRKNHPSPDKDHRLLEGGEPDTQTKLVDGEKNSQPKAGRSSPGDASVI